MMLLLLLLLFEFFLLLVLGGNYGGVRFNQAQPHCPLVILWFFLQLSTRRKFGIDNVFVWLVMLASDSTRAI
jgi:hypothetical protein